MTRYLISFPSGAMDHVPAEEFPAVGEAAHAVVLAAMSLRWLVSLYRVRARLRCGRSRPPEEAMDAGVWVFGGGLAEDVDPSWWPVTGRSPLALTRRPRSSTEGSRSSTCPLGRQRWSGPRRSRPPAAVLKRSASSCPTRRWATERSPTWPIRARGRNITHRLRERPVTRRGRGCSFSAAAGV